MAASLDQKSPNVLLQSLCCRITGKSEGSLAASGPIAGVFYMPPVSVAFYTS